MMAVTRYKQLVDAFATDIRSGALSPGTKLPTHRQLAKQHNIALVTASRVYAELEQMGLVSGETGRGTFVRETELPLSHGVDQPECFEGMVDLNFNSPSLPGQTELLRGALRKLASSGDLETVLKYQPHAGRKHERAMIAQHLETRGLQVHAEQVLIVSGAQHGLAVSVMTLLKPGDVVAVDALTYSGFKVLADVHRLELVSIPLTDQSPDLDALEQLCRRRNVKAVYAIPTLHNPMGWVMDLEWRQRLIEISRQHDLVIIEDAAYAFLDASPPPPIAELAPDITVYISGLSKNIATGFRVGYIAAPDKWISLLERTVRATTWNTPGLMTALVCSWLADGTVNQLEKDKRRDAADRQQVAAEVFAGMNFLAHPSSYFLWLPLPEEVRADQLVMALLRENISVSTAEPFATTEHVPHALRIALGSEELPVLKKALLRVRKLVEHYAYAV